MRSHLSSPIPRRLHTGARPSITATIYQRPSLQAPLSPSAFSIHPNHPRTHPQTSRCLAPAVDTRPPELTRCMYMTWLSFDRIRIFLLSCLPACRLACLPPSLNGCLANSSSFLRDYQKSVRSCCSSASRPCKFLSDRQPFRPSARRRSSISSSIDGNSPTPLATLFFLQTYPVQTSLHP